MHHSSLVQHETVLKKEKEIKVVAYFYNFLGFIGSDS